MSTLTTYGQAKGELSLVVNNGSSPDDARVMQRTNEAMREIVRATRGLFVNGQVELLAAVDPSGVFQLPPDCLSVISLEQIGVDATVPMATGGFFSLTRTGLFVDADDWTDLAVQNLGQPTVGGQLVTQWRLPEIRAGVTQVRVIATRRFVPVTGDADVLIVQNLEAIKSMMLSLQQRQRRDDPTSAAANRADALSSMAEEGRQYWLDPTHQAERRAMWSVDENTYAAGTLGKATAQLALSIRDGRTLGRSRFHRIVRRALQWIYQRRYEFELAGRSKVYDGTTPASSITLAAPPTTLSGVITPPVTPELLRTVVQGLLAEDNQPLDNPDKPRSEATTAPDLTISKQFFIEATSLLQSQLTNEQALRRHSAYEADVASSLATNQPASLGYLTAQIALDLPDGLSYSRAEWRRRVRQAWEMAVDHANFIYRREAYEGEALALPTPVADTSVVTFPMEVIKLLTEALMNQDGKDDGYGKERKDRALELIERNITAQIETERRTTREARAAQNEDFSFGYTTARLGLDLPAALSYSDRQIAACCNEAEERLWNSGLWKDAHYRFSARVSACGTVELPEDTTAILYAEFCGLPVEIRNARFQYLGCRVRASAAAVGVAGQIALDDVGTTECGTRVYRLAGCTPAVNACLRVVALRKWAPKRDDGDVLLIQCYPALKLMVQSVLARLTSPPDFTGSNIFAANAKSALEDQLDHEHPAEVIRPQITMPGLQGRGSSWQRLNGCAH